VPGLREVVESVFGAECVAKGLSITESRQTFSLKKDRNEKAIAVHLQACRSWPANTRRVDALFICLPANSQAFLIVLVELKGGNVEKGITQLSQSAKMLCKGATDSPAPHSSKLHGWLNGDRTDGHGGHVLGVIVSRQGLPQEQQKRKAARMAQKLVIRMRTTRQLSTTMDELTSWISSRNWLSHP